MIFKGVIIDLDDTIYNYTECHKNGYDILLNYLSEISLIDISIISDKYKYFKKELNINLINRASSHNKLLVIQKIFEYYKLPYLKILTALQIYWEGFYDKIFLNMGVFELLIYLKENKIPICILTDHTLKEQYEKCEKLNILEYVDYMVSSEEVGEEKPNKKMFYYALDKLKLSKEEVIMIGDNFDKDIVGSIQFEILSFYYNIESKNNIILCDNYFEFDNFNNLLLFIQNINDELNIFSLMSKYYGMRYDLIQSGGGNTSFKLNNLIFIKESGISLTDITNSNGYLILNNDKIKYDIDNNLIIYNNFDKYQLFYKNKKPSMETYMHSILLKYTVHLHPIQINYIGIRKNGFEIFKSLFPESLIINYFTPGITLCKEIYKLYKNEKIIFLLNHGVIFTSNDYDELKILIDETINICEKFNGSYFIKYKNVNKINELYKEFDKNLITYCSDDIISNNHITNIELFIENTTFPDKIVYCGISSLIIKNINIQNDFNNYIKKYNDIPKIIIYNSNIYITSISIKKCKEIEDILKSNILISNNNSNISYLQDDEIKFLNNWDIEKYRKNIK